MSNREGRIVATGVNPHGVPWKEISFIDENKQEKRQSSKKKDIKEKNSENTNRNIP